MRSLLLALIITSLSSLLLNAQELQKSVSFVQNFKTYQSSLPRETVYLHTDRDVYTKNDQIWFSVYVVAGGLNFLSDISNVLYVEFIHPNGVIEQRVNVRVNDGRGEGYIPIDNLKSGTYEIKAYTLWSQNFDESYSFKKTVQVSSSENENLTSNNVDQAAVSDLQFMPEGGQLVSGLESVVAFKATNAKGFGVEFSGKVFDQNDQLISDIGSVHKGMGKFKFIPVAGNQYHAIVNGTRFELPHTNNSGITLSVEKKDNLIIAGIQRSENLTLNEDLLLFAHVRGEIFYASPVKIDNKKKALVSVSPDIFPTGVIHFTALYDGKPVTERLIFNKNKSDDISLEINTGKSAFDKRSRIDSEFRLISNSEIDRATSSVSVFDLSLNGYNPNESNIVTKFYFENNVKGNLEDPGFYLSDDPNANEYLDLLLLSQGWRTYDMDLLANTSEIILDISPEKGFSVSGTVKRVIGRRPLKNASVMLIPGVDVDKSKFTVTDDDGRFLFNDLDLVGEKIVTIKVQHPDRGTSVHIDIDEQFDGFATSYDKVYQKQFNSSITEIPENLTELSRRAENNSENYTASYDFEMTGEFDEITVEAKKVQDNYVDQLISEGLQGTGTQLDLDEQEHLKNLSIEIILNQIPGVTANASTRNIYVETGFISFASGRLPPLIFIDGVQVDNQTLLSMNSSEVKNLSVARSNSDLSIFGAEGAGGAIMVTTREVGTYQTSKPGTITEYINAFQEEAFFYTPKYGINVPSDLDKEDTRFTLHWEPVLDFENFLAQTSFWTNDIPSEYLIEIQGITEDGIPFFATKVFAVSDN